MGKEHFLFLFLITSRELLKNSGRQALLRSHKTKPASALRSDYSPCLYRLETGLQTLMFPETRSICRIQTCMIFRWKHACLHDSINSEYGTNTKWAKNGPNRSVCKEYPGMAIHLTCLGQSAIRSCHSSVQWLWFASSRLVGHDGAGHALRSGVDVPTKLDTLEKSLETSKTYRIRRHETLIVCECLSRCPRQTYDCDFYWWTCIGDSNLSGLRLLYFNGWLFFFGGGGQVSFFLWIPALLFLFFCFSCFCAFPASWLFCFSAFPLFAFSAFLHILASLFSAFPLFAFPASLLLCLSASVPFSFLLLCFYRFCFSCFSAFLLLCLSTTSTFSFLQSCVFAALLPAVLLLCFLSLLSLCFSFSSALFSPVCILNETLERP